MPAAAKAMSLTGFDQANLGENRTGIIGHGWAYVARMKSGFVVRRKLPRIASELWTAPSPIYWGQA